MVHEFALYLEDLSTILEQMRDVSFVYDNKDLFHRMAHVLRLMPGQQVVLFDVDRQALFRLEALQGKTRIVGEILSQRIHTPPEPCINFLLPVLKRDDLAEAVYGLTEVGVNNIQLISTHKVQRKWGGQQELERLERIIIAAAEQAKQFALPRIHQPINLENFMQQLHTSATKLFADPEGMPLFDCIQQVHMHHPKELYLMIGPEADLTSTEKDYLHDAQFKFFKLTPTILRARQAAPISAAIFRSIF